MLIKLHSQATTTPKIRAAIQASDEPAWVLAERPGTTEQTKSWSPRCIDMSGSTTNSFRNRPWEASRPCKP